MLMVVLMALGTSVTASAVEVTSAVGVCCWLMPNVGAVANGLRLRQGRVVDDVVVVLTSVFLSCTVADDVRSCGCCCCGDGGGGGDCRC